MLLLARGSSTERLRSACLALVSLASLLSLCGVCLYTSSSCTYVYSDGCTHPLSPHTASSMFRRSLLPRSTAEVPVGCRQGRREPFRLPALLHRFTRHVGEGVIFRISGAPPPHPTLLLRTAFVSRRWCSISSGARGVANQQYLRRDDASSARAFPRVCKRNPSCSARAADGSMLDRTGLL